MWVVIAQVSFILYVNTVLWMFESLKPIEDKPILERYIDFTSLFIILIIL